MQGEFLQQLYPQPPAGQVRRKLEEFLNKQGLRYDQGIQFAAVFYDSQGKIAAAGVLQKNVLKCVAVDEAYRGEGLTASVISALRSAAFAQGQRRLFLFTKPQNDRMFVEFGFYEIARTGDMLLMESQRGGAQQFVDSLARGQGEQAAVVANCNPFTLGHRYLIEQAAAQCDTLHLFILSEDASLFSAQTRMELARQGTADLANVLLHPTSDYLISAATFPTYFLKEGQMEGGAGGALDLEIFGQYFVPALNIKRRFVGQEPFSPTTARYNRQMKEILPRFGVEVTEMPRKEQGGAAVSASRVRALLAEDKLEEIRPLVPETTWAFLQSSGGRSVAQRVRQSR